MHASFDRRTSGLSVAGLRHPCINCNRFSSLVVTAGNIFNSGLFSMKPFEGAFAQVVVEWGLAGDLSLVTVSAL